MKKISLIVLSLALMICVGISLTFGINPLNAKADEAAFGFTAENGASVRISDRSGIRFTVNIPESDYASVVNGGEYIDENSAIGMIIVPYSYVTDYEAYKLENPTVGYYEYFNEVKGKMKDFVYAPEQIAANAIVGGYRIKGALVDIKEDNLERDFVAIGYVKKSGEYTYTTVNEDDNARNITEVATAAVEDNEKTTSEQRAKLCELYNITYHTVTYDKVTEYYANNAYGKNYELPEVLTVDGYNFRWAVAANGEDYVVTGGKLDKDIVVSAKWTVNIAERDIPRNTDNTKDMTGITENGGVYELDYIVAANKCAEGAMAAETEAQKAAIIAKYNVYKAYIDGNVYNADFVESESIKTLKSSLGAEAETAITNAETLKTEIDELGDKVIAASDKELLGRLYESYNEISDDYKFAVYNAELLTAAINKYFEAARIEEENASGDVTLFRFNEVLGLTQVKPFAGGSYSFSKDESLAGESGSLKIDFDGSVGWVTMAFATIAQNSFDEIHIWIKNVSDNKRMFTVNWKPSNAAYDENGNKIEINGNLLPKNSGWIDFVVLNDGAKNEFNMTSLNDANGSINSVGTLYIGKVVGVSNVSKVNKLVSPIELKDSYTADEVADIKSASAIYDSLSAERKTKLAAGVEDKLIALRAKVANYYTIGDLGMSDVINAPGWAGYSANLINEMQGTIVFKVKGMALTDGAFYVNLFHDGSKNINQSGAGVSMWVRNHNNTLLFQNAGDLIVGFNGGKTVSSEKTYVFYYTYNVAEDYSKLTVSVKIDEEGGDTIVEGSREITTVNFTDFGTYTVKQWLTEHENKDKHKTINFNSGNSNGLNISSAW